MFLNMERSLQPKQFTYCQNLQSFKILLKTYHNKKGTRVNGRLTIVTQTYDIDENVHCLLLKYKTIL